MNISRYRYILLSVCITLTGVSFFTVFWSDITAMYSRDIAPMGLLQAMIPLRNPDPIAIPIDIESISSERYLYTLVQELQKRSSSGIILPIEAKYTSFVDVKIDGNDTVFSFTGITPIRLPTSSFFFDRYNRQPSISGEVISGTGKHLGKKVIALTFDDGPSGKHTNTLLDILKSYKVRATFFVLGARALEHPEILRREVDE